MKLVFVASPQRTLYLGERTKTCWLGIRIMYPSGAICIPTDVVSVRAWNQDMYPSGAICIHTDGCFSEGLESGYVPELSDMYTYRRLFQ